MVDTDYTPIIAGSVAADDWPAVAAHDSRRSVRPRHRKDHCQLVEVRLPERQDEVTSGAVTALIVVVVHKHCDTQVNKVILYK